MSDLTITIPLSWLSFLTWSGFWVVYLYVGVILLVSLASLGLYRAITNSRKNTITVAWGEDRCLPLFVALVVLGWPWVVWRFVRLLIEGRQP